MGIHTTFGGVFIPLRMGRVLLRSWVNIRHPTPMSETPAEYLTRIRVARAAEPAGRTRVGDLGKEGERDRTQLGFTRGFSAGLKVPMIRDTKGIPCQMEKVVSRCWLLKCVAEAKQHFVTTTTTNAYLTVFKG